MFKARIIKLSISAHIIYEDNDNVLGETKTEPIDIYRGTDINYELIEKIEQLALQEFASGRLTKG